MTRQKRYFPLETVPDDGLRIANYDENTVVNQGTSDRPSPQLTFHHVHGSNIQILRGGRIAKRKESFCKGLAFSSRPIQLEENVCIRFAEVVTNWSGVLRFGVTNVNPETFSDIELPKFACPDLTSKEGYWAKALPERYCVAGSILNFHVNNEGELYYGINGVHKGQFLNGINVNSPLWVIVDIYGNSASLEFIDPNEVRFRSTRAGSRNRVSSRPLSASSISQAPVPASTPTSHISSSSQVHPISNVSSRSTLPLSRYHSGVHFTPLTFHTVCGKHISLSSGYTVAERHTGEYACGYVFTSRPLAFNEKIVLQILDVEPAYTGSMAFGLTCCNPASLQGSSLPVDSDDLLERSEYWVGIKDVAAQPKVTDELSFWISRKGEVYFAKNNCAPRIIIHVDTSVRLWAYFDVYGTTQRIRLLGCIKVDSEAATVTQRIPPLPTGSRTSVSLLDLSPEIRSAWPSTSTNTGLQTHQVVEPASLMGRRTQSETGDSFNGVYLHIPATRNERSTTVSDPSRAARPVFTMSGESFIDFLESLDSRHGGPTSGSAFPHRPHFPPPPVPSRTSTQVLPSRPPTLPPHRQVLSTSNVQQQQQRLGDDERELGDECKICMNAKVNCVIYTCGHMSMCYECATETWHVNGECPICRKKIEDVIKIYKA